MKLESQLQTYCKKEKLASTEAYLSLLCGKKVRTSLASDTMNVVLKKEFLCNSQICHNYVRCSLMNLFCFFINPTSFIPYVHVIDYLPIEKI